MRTNGTISFELDVPPTTNEYGETIAQTNEWSEPIPCMITTVTDNRKGRYEDGEFHQATYRVLLEGLDLAIGDRVRLTRRCESLGEHRVISVEPVQTFNRTSVLV